MEKASLAYDEESSVAYLRYMSLSEKKEKDTRENSQQTSSSMTIALRRPVTMTAVMMIPSSDDSSYDDGSY